MDGVARSFELMKDHTTFKIGGSVLAMCFPDSIECAVHLCANFQKQGITPYIMGKGSNILADDRNLNIVVINTTKLRNMRLTDTVITADSGVPLSMLAAFAYENGLTGLEFVHGIPGTLGGAVVMNAGAYGFEMKDVVFATTAYSVDKGKYTVINSAHGFSYRNSIFSGSNDIILSSVISLEKGYKEEIAHKMEDYASRRKESQPLDMPSAGSIFKRPGEGYAAALIEQAGLKGFSIGGAQISVKHAGFIVNTGNATFDDVTALIKHVQEEVEKQTGTMLELEVQVWKS